jgi:hypothetical protein
MASHGKVLDLFQDRYLQLQDVEGNAQPFPKLVAYGQYDNNITVYKMETNHEIFMGLIQDFTDRFARDTEQEQWGWVVQWEVTESAPAGAASATRCPNTPAFKRARLWTDKDMILQKPYQAHKPPELAVDSQAFNRDLLEDEDMLRMLLDIVQAPDELVPNYIEFLYQLIDHFEGDGHALECALKQEIPSLWDFEKHPVLQAEYEATAKDASNLDIVVDGDFASDPNSEPKERSTYREKRFGLQPPKSKLSKPSASLINIPIDEDKRRKYYAACFQSRKRATDLLLEAGMTWRQIMNFTTGQEAHPKNTPERETGRGLNHYLRNQPYYRKQNLDRMMAEARVSARLEAEAERATRRAILEAFDPARPQQAGLLTARAPLIPPTPSSALRPDLFPVSSVRTPCVEEEGPDVDPIEAVPYLVSGFLKSKVFKGVKREAVCLSDTENRLLGLSEDADDIEEEEVNTEADEQEGNDGIEGDDGDDDDDDDDADSDLDDDAMDLGSPPEADGSESPEQEPEPSFSGPPVSNFLQNVPITQMQQFSSLFNPGLQQLFAHQILLPQQVAATVAPNLGPTASPWPTHPVNGGVQGQQLAPISVPALAPPSITITAASGVNSALGTSTQLQVQGQTNHSPYPQFPGANTVQQLQHPVPGSINHSALSPGLNGLSLNTPTHSTFASGPSTPLLPLPSPRNVSFSPPRQGIQRPHVPKTIKIVGSATASQPTALVEPVPILIYFPAILHDRAIVSNAHERTDAVMLGYKTNGDTELSRALFLPAQIAVLLQRRVKEGGYKVLEAYSNENLDLVLPGGDAAQRERNGTHKAAYSKLLQAFQLMVACEDREEDLTKRWRVSPGFATEKQRGAVWEGWGVQIDSRIEISENERKGRLEGSLADWSTELSRKDREFEAALEAEVLSMKDEPWDNDG